MRNGSFIFYLNHAVSSAETRALAIILNISCLLKIGFRKIASLKDADILRASASYSLATLLSKRNLRPHPSQII